MAPDGQRDQLHDRQSGHTRTRRPHPQRTHRRQAGRLRGSQGIGHARRAGFGFVEAQQLCRLRRGPGERDRGQDA
ncbi:hypothetical protein EVA_14226 [gut metagenome]|uniref:Uncharacterized protein n=1 Tax=gut metagenome TaxID=749906 RepID=J9FRU8_9ZZZZ